MVIDLFAVGVLLVSGFGLAFGFQRWEVRFTIGDDGAPRPVRAGLTFSGSVLVWIGVTAAVCFGWYQGSWNAAGSEAANAIGMSDGSYLLHAAVSADAVASNDRAARCYFLAVPVDVDGRARGSLRLYQVSEPELCVLTGASDVLPVVLTIHHDRERGVRSVRISIPGSMCDPPDTPAPDTHPI